MSIALVDELNIEHVAPFGVTNWSAVAGFPCFAERAGFVDGGAGCVWRGVYVPSTNQYLIALLLVDAEKSVLHPTPLRKKAHDQFSGPSAAEFAEALRAAAMAG